MVGLVFDNGPIILCAGETAYVVGLGVALRHVCDC
jgi:hypothetical protein